MNIVKHKSSFPSIFSDDFDNLFQGFFRPINYPSAFGKGEHLPAVDIEEKEDCYLLMADLPGFNKDEISVSFHDGQLSIRAEHTEESEKKQKEGNVLKERRYGSFYRSFNFGSNVAEQDVSAQFENGVLELRIPKVEPAELAAKKIEIK